MFVDIIKRKNAADEEIARKWFDQVLRKTLYLKKL